MQDKRVGIASTAGNYYSASIGQVCVPPNVDRDEFVQDCLNSGFISVQPIVNSAIHRVRCDKWTLQQIDFPLQSDQFGSYVVYVVESKSKQPFVVASFNSIQEYQDLKENQFSLVKRTDIGTVSLIGDGRGRISISVNSEKEGNGRFDINISNPDESAKFNVNIKGTADVFSSGKVSVKTNDEILLESTDGTDNSTLSITKDSIKLDEGTEPMLLGQTTIDLLKEFINLVATSTNAGGPLSNASQISALAAELENLLSQKSKLD